MRLLAFNIPALFDLEQTGSQAETRFFTFSTWRTLRPYGHYGPASGWTNNATSLNGECIGFNMRFESDPIEQTARLLRSARQCIAAVRETRGLTRELIGATHDHICESAIVIKRTDEVLERLRAYGAARDIPIASALLKQST